MNVLIVEDETAAATKLQSLLSRSTLDPYRAVIETVVETVRWVKDNPLPRIWFFRIFIWRTDRLS